ncbi:hypothetical protein ABIE78_000772 [Sinorhizobium fredii]|uniref:hypothetical protein n=1 Tax=Rhizobium fredii TaxID=380 RepID=UPI001CC23EE4|nr:hypothetical protein [Sinorhizobium fredii]
MTNYLGGSRMYATVRVSAAPVVAVLVSLAGVSEAANLPCSGKKGGISGCQGDTFICNDGSVSGSKKSCSSYMGAAGLLQAGNADMVPSSDKDCSCRSGALCTGPRGGKFCTTDSGEKSYLRK